jgi:mevalonate kinase
MLKKIGLFITFLFSAKLAIADLASNQVPAEDKVIKTLSCPGKTFILGEYIALEGKPVLIVNTSPRFQLQEYQDTIPDSKIIPQSPAGRLLQSIEIDNVRFIDPYKGKGGLGASSAQFLLVLASKQKIHSFKELLTIYKSYVESGSGADIVSQWKGGIVLYHRNKSIVESHDWPFEKQGFFLLRTGKKLKTHEHLSKDLIYPTGELTEIANSGIKAFLNKDITNFSKAITDYSNKLRGSDLVDENTLGMLDKIRKIPGVLAAKGCGAMGADIIFVLVDKGIKLPEEYEVVATESDLDMHGLMTNE